MPACFLNIQPRNPYIPLHMIAIMLDIKCCGSGASRLLVGKSSR
nr:MAG TPA: hypothetical protein [Caudoviricetes sp.]